MWGIRFVNLTKVLQSSFLKFSLVLTGVILAAYIAAGVIAFQAVHTDLDGRVLHSAELTASRLIDTYRSGSRDELVREVNLRSAAADRDDQLVWLGMENGEFLAGDQLNSALVLKEGDVDGVVINADPEDRYRLVVREFGGFRLIVARSYEESDEIQQRVLVAFGLATGFVILFSIITALFLAQRSQNRLDAINETMRAVSQGKMSARVPVSGKGRLQDLDQLAVDINAALSQLETTVDGIRQVTNDIAHDLRTPLNRLGILLEEARAPGINESDFEQSLSEAAGEVKRLTSVFDALLRIAQIEAGARKSRFTMVDLKDIAETLCDAYQPVAEENAQTLEFIKPAGKIANVLGDRDLLTQLFANLVENAIRHSGRGSRISVKICQGAGGVEMNVSNTGIGIPESEYENVFKRFFRLDSARHTSGSGLGLALVKAIADLHGAKTTLQDTAPGLSVHVKFPSAGRHVLRAGS